MAISRNESLGREELAKRAPVIGGGLVVAAALLVGAASFIDGTNAGFGDRVPVYFLTGAVGFIGALLYMRTSPQEGTAVLRRATGVGCVSVVGVGLGTEAVIYGLIYVVPALSLYLTSAVIVACGLLYWSIRNWRAVNDLTRPW